MHRAAAAGEELGWVALSEFQHAAGVQHFPAQASGTSLWQFSARFHRDIFFERRRILRYGAAMTATGVIEEIKHLPRAEQSRVIQFAFELARERQLSGEKLAGLAQSMANTNDPAEVSKLRDEIHRGFYGE